MVITFLVLVWVAGSLAVAWHRSAVQGRGPAAARRPLRHLGWGAALLAVALSGLGPFSVGNMLALLALAASGVILIFRQRLAARVLPFALLAVGLAKFWQLSSYRWGVSAYLTAGQVVTGPGT